MMYHVKQVFKCGLTLFTACLLGGGLAQGFERSVIIDDKGFNVPYIATQSIEGTSQSAVLSWQCKYDSAAQNGSQAEPTGINIVVENFDSENNVGLVPVTYSFDEQSSGTVRFFAVDDSLVYFI
jgi:hypothetical protein